MHTFGHSKPGICQLLGVTILGLHGATLQGSLRPLERACFLSDGTEMNSTQEGGSGRDAYPLFVAK
jgi:hypothetical protein